MPYKHVIHFFALALAGLLAYSNAIAAPFQFDDVGYILNNPWIRSLPNLADTSGTRYVGFASFALNYASCGLDARCYHATNVGIHLLNAAILYLIVNRTISASPKKRLDNMSTGANGPFLDAPFMAALVFLLHPVQTQAVTYVSQRFASLATFFYLLSLLLYIVYRTRQGGDEKTRKGTYIFYALSLAAAVAAQKTKEISFTLPFIITLYEFTFLKNAEKPGKRLLRLVPFYLTLIIVPLSLFSPADGNSFGEILRKAQIFDLRSISAHDYLITEFRVIMTYLRLIVAPVNQTVIYDYPVYNSVFAPQVLLSLLAEGVMLISAGLLYLRARKNASITGLMASFGVFWFFITLSVESSIIPISDVIFEHRVYLPSAGLAMGFGTAFTALSNMADMAAATTARRRSVRYSKAVLTAVLAATLMAATYSRNGVWTDELKLWKDIVEKAPDKKSPNYNIHYNLGVAYHHKGEVEAAAKQYAKAIELDPDHDEANSNLAKIYYGKRDYRKASERYREAIRAAPAKADYHYEYGNVLQKLNDDAGAIIAYGKAVDIRPSFEDAHYNMAYVYQSAGDYVNALSHYTVVTRLNAASADAHLNMGRIYKKLGLVEDARREFKTTLSIKPAFPGARDELESLPKARRERNPKRN